MKESKLTLFNDDLYYTGVETENNDYHGWLVRFIQSFPSPILGHTTESVAIREQDIDKVIEFLEGLKST